MHELGIADGILAVACDIAGERSVRRVTVRIGADQRIVADSLEFGFQLLAENSVCAGAALECIPVAGDVVLVDAVELQGDPPTIIRRPGSEVVEPPHDPALHADPHQHAGPHQHDHDAAQASFGSTTTHGGS